MKYNRIKKMWKPNIKRLVRISWIRTQAKEVFERLKKETELDSSYFTDEELEHYVNFLLRVHSDMWPAIDDVHNEGIL